MRSSIPKSSLKAPTSPLDSSILPTGRFSQFFELLRRGIFIKVVLGHEPNRRQKRQPVEQPVLTALVLADPRVLETSLYTVLIYIRQASFVLTLLTSIDRTVAKKEAPHRTLRPVQSGRAAPSLLRRLHSGTFFTGQVATAVVALCDAADDTAAVVVFCEVGEIMKP